MKNHFAFLIFLFITTTLTAQHQSEISGLYGECEIGFFTCLQMELKPNGTFDYFIFYDVGGGSVLEGQWQFKNDTIYLNTFKQPKQQKSIIIDTQSDNKNFINIRVYDYDSLKMGFAEIIINNKIQMYCDKNGLITVPDMPIESITVKFSTESTTFNLNGEKGNNISLFIPILDGAIPSYLSNEKWLYKKNKLIPYLRSNKNYNKKYALKKTELNNKRF